MTTTAELLLDAFGRIDESVHEVLDGLTLDDLTHRPAPDANTIAWLVWHLTRIQDDHIAGVADFEQEWTAGGFYDRFGLPFEPDAHGYGHTSDDVAAVRVDAEQLRGYYEAVAAQTRRYVEGLADDELDRIVDRRWDPPVTLAVRLVSVVADDLQHAGQAAYIRGLLPGR